SARRAPPPARQLGPGKRKGPPLWAARFGEVPACCGLTPGTTPGFRQLRRRALARERLRLDRVELGLADRSAVEQPLRTLDLRGRPRFARNGPDVGIRLGLRLSH